MRMLDEATLTAQRSPSPSYQVQAHFEARGRGPFDRPVGNFSLVTSYLPGATAGLVAVVLAADDALLRFYVAEDGAGTTIRVSRVAEPEQAAAWRFPADDRALLTAAAPVTGLDAWRQEDEVRLYYAAGEQVGYTVSTDDGVTWSAAVTLETIPGATIADLCVAWRPTTQGGPWHAGYSVRSGGDWWPRIHNGTTAENLYGAGWRFGGFHHTGELGTAQGWTPLLLFRDPDVGPTRILAAGWAPGELSFATVIDRTHGGRYGLRLNACRARAGAGATAMLVVEAGYAGAAYLCWSILDGDANHGPIQVGRQAAVDEPMLLPSLPTGDVIGKEGAIGCTLVDDGAGNLYLCTPRSVLRAPALAPPAGVYTPIRYDYQVGGSLEIVFSARDFPPVPLGVLLVLTRTVTKQGVGGSQQIRLRVMRIQRSAGRVQLLCVDPLGELGVTRFRRPCVLEAGQSDYAAIAQTCFRMGLYVQDTCDGGALYDGLEIVLKPGETVASALYRMGQRRRFGLVPDNGGAYGLSLMMPGADPLGTGAYADTPHLYGGAAGQPLAEAGEMVDGRRYAVAFYMGMASTDPEEGAAVAMALGPAVDGVRPIPVTVSNRYLNSPEKLAAAARAETERQRQVSVEARLTAPANLALELYDRIAATAPDLGWVERPFRVRSIRERWADGRLWQEIEVGVWL